MKSSRFNEVQKRAILAEASTTGDTVDTICRRHQISPATYYKWKKYFSDRATSEKRRLRELEAENARLKKLFMELQLDHDILKEGFDVLKKIQSQRNENA